ncbi:MAG: ketoacyl-ACP synthase III [Anaerolineales bacterium]|nr:ketoacyl-ACP synthase III [Anaerolineales bacterium]
MRYSGITGWGKYVPERVLTNQDLEKMVETSDEWILARTGIKERRIAGPDEAVSTMSLAASQDALAVAGLDPRDLDLIIAATSTPDYLTPPVSSMIQGMLAAPHAAAFDLAAGCTGFVYALATAHQFIATGTYDNVLVIGAEITSRFVDWEDRATCVLFGDGAGAVVLQASEAPTGILSFVLGSEGTEYDALIVPAGGSRHPPCQEALDKRMHYIKMDGRRVFKFATKTPVEAAVRVIEGSGLSVDDIALLIPHQANLRIIQCLAKSLGMPLEKVYINLDRYGNTSAASIPVALCEAMEEGRVKEGDNVLLLGFGAGLTWAAAVVKIGVPQALSWPISWPLASLKDRSFCSVRSLARGAVGVLSAIVGALLLPLYSSTDKRD